MTEQDIYHELQQIFAQVFRRTDISLTPTLTAKDVPGWDSFKQVSLLMATEAFFKVRFDSDDVDQMANVGDLVRAVARHTG
jgi:acyl carrier protein